MNWWQILVLILLILVVLYLFAAFVCLGMSTNFKNKLQERLKAMSIILTEEKSLLLLAFSNLEKAGKLKEEDLALVKMIKELNPEDLKEDQINEISSKLTQGWSKYEFIISKVYKKRSNEPIENYKDLSANMMQCSASYNADIKGYNYWISVPLAGFFPYLAGYRKKELIK